MEINNKTNESDKFTNYLITDSRQQSPPYEWSEGIFQRFKPVSGNFPIGNNYNGDDYCVNNPTGRAFTANPCGYWNNTEYQFNPGKTFTVNKGDTRGNLFPINSKNVESNIINNKLTSPPQNRVVFGYARIGEEYRNR